MSQFRDLHNKWLALTARDTNERALLGQALIQTAKDERISDNLPELYEIIYQTISACSQLADKDNHYKKNLKSALEYLFVITLKIKAFHYGNVEEYFDRTDQCYQENINYTQKSTLDIYNETRHYNFDSDNALNRINYLISIGTDFCSNKLYSYAYDFFLSAQNLLALSSIEIEKYKKIDASIKHLLYHPIFSFGIYCAKNEQIKEAKRHMTNALNYIKEGEERRLSEVYATLAELSTHSKFYDLDDHFSTHGYLILAINNTMHNAKANGLTNSKINEIIEINLIGNYVDIFKMLLHIRKESRDAYFKYPGITALQNKIPFPGCERNILVRVYNANISENQTYEFDFSDTKIILADGTITDPKSNKKRGSIELAREDEVSAPRIKIQRYLPGECPSPSSDESITPPPPPPKIIRHPFTQ